MTDLASDADEDAIVEEKEATTDSEEPPLSNDTKMTDLALEAYEDDEDEEDSSEYGGGAEHGDNSNNREAGTDREIHDTYWGIKTKDVPHTFDWDQIKRDHSAECTELPKGNLLFPFKYVALFSRSPSENGDAQSPRKRYKALRFQVDMLKAWIH